ncbi:MAG TPA: hypothetical protein VNI77_03085 [Nitrososphaera sp.]|nr:hypothetical protein [Nitrososphaera sp.]
MNMGQMMLVIGAFAMLSLLTLSINATIVNSLSLTAESEMTLNAHAFAQSMIDEILTKHFDEKTRRYRAYGPADLTPLNSLGPDPNEKTWGEYDSTFQSRSKFDDVDDYHGYKRFVKNALGWRFEVKDSVHYVKEDKDSLNVVSSTPTFIKRITVYVYNDNLPKDANGNIVPLVMRDLAVYRRFF